MNTIKLVLLLSSLAGILMIIGYFVAGKTGVIIAFVLSLILQFRELLVFGPDCSQDVRGQGGHRGIGAPVVTIRSGI